jgi:hypothetical protein
MPQYTNTYVKLSPASDIAKFAKPWYKIIRKENPMFGNQTPKWKRERGQGARPAAYLREDGGRVPVTVTASEAARIVATRDGGEMQLTAAEVYRTVTARAQSKTSVMRNQFREKWCPDPDTSSQT